MSLIKIIFPFFLIFLFFQRSSSLYSSDQSVQCTIRAGVPTTTTNKSMNLEDRSTSSSPSISTSTSTSINSNSIAKSTQQTHQKSAVLRAAEETVKVCFF